MNITEIPLGSTISIIASKHKKSIELKTVVKRNFNNNLLVAPITNDKNQPLSFAVNDIRITVVYIDNNKMPVIWRNVTIKHITIENESFHRIIQSTAGRVGERRKHPRFFTGTEGVIKIGLSQKSINIRIKDISFNGISFIAEGNVDFEGSLIHILFKDNENNVLNVASNVIRKQPIKGKNSYLYGCSIVEPASNKELERYILSLRSGR